MSRSGDSCVLPRATLPLALMATGAHSSSTFFPIGGRFRGSVDATPEIEGSRSVESRRN